MVFATNHAAGCILMADNMMTRTDNLAIYMDSYKQGMLFDQGVDGEITDPTTVQDPVQTITDELTSFTDADAVVAAFYGRAGVVCKSDVVRKAMAQLEKTSKLEVRRTPARTGTGKPSTFFTSSKGQTVEVRSPLGTSAS
jgi:hypothetical protein